MSDYQSANVPLEPFGKARPRVTAGHTYMPSSYTKARDSLRLLDVYKRQTMPPTALSYLTMAAVAVALCGLPLFALAVALARAARDVQPTRPDEGEWE